MRVEIMRRLALIGLCLCAWCATIQTSVAAETVFPANGDTISIVYCYTSEQQTTDYYMSVATSSSGTVALGYSTSAMKDALWQVVYETGSTTNFRLQNVNRPVWLRITPTNNTALSVVSDKDNSSVLHFSDDIILGTYSATALLQYANAGKTYYVRFNMGSNGGWRTSDNITSAAGLRIDRWASRHSTTLTHTSVPQSMDFAFAENQTDADTQTQEVKYTITITDSTYVHNCAGNSRVHVDEKVEVTYKPNDIFAKGYDLKWRWQRQKSTTEADTSYLTADLIVNKVTDQRDEWPRAMMHYTAPQTLNPTAANQPNWQLSVVPDKGSPLNIMAIPTTSGGATIGTEKRYVNYEDELVLEIWKGGNQVAEKRMLVTRHAFHYSVVDNLLSNIEPPSHYFPAQASSTASLSKEFKIILTHCTGEALLDMNDNFAEQNGKEIWNKTKLDTLTRADIPEEDRTFSFTDADLQGSVDWLSWKIDDDTPLTITAQPNTSSVSRKALFVASLKYREHQVLIHTKMFQYGSNEEGGRKFVASKGISGGELDAEGRQKVHQLETVLYYEAGEVVELRPNETMFGGYMRWYDYETGKAPQYTKDGKETPNFWAGRPRFKNKSNSTVWDMTAINDDPVYSHGLYAYSNQEGGEINLKTRDFIPPTINAWTDQQERWIACDLSAYRDHKITNEAVQEPTLSTRQIFHLIPGQRMADEIDALDAGQAYEDYHYIAPTNKEIFLQTRFAHYTNGGFVQHPSELCYFFWGNNSGTGKRLQRLGIAQGTSLVNGTWYIKRPNSTTFSEYTMNYNNDYASVSYDQAGTVVYELRIPASAMSSGKEVVLARFTVDYMDRQECGPTEAAGQAIISGEEIADNYVVMTLQDFNFGAKPNTTDAVYYDGHLPWEESSYGYCYVPGKKYGDGTELSYFRNVNNPYPYYGEYCLVNRVGYDKYTNTWLQDTEQHGGAANGYCMYVDGAQRPGLVTSVSTNRSICSGQQLYCSAWICNPSKEKEGALPIFRFNVQGRNKNADGTYGDWEDVGVFFAGELAKQSGWRQVVFPIKSANNYEESRVSIYNFSATNSGNDFLIDDVCLFASKLPLTAYQLMTTCKSSDVETAVARIDYSLMPDRSCGDIYYDIYDATANKALSAEYYNVYGDQTLTNCGCIIIPQADYDPTQSKDADYRKTMCRDVDESRLVYPSVADFVDSLMSAYYRVNAEITSDATKPIKEVTMKGYVPFTENGTTRYVMYVGHVATKAMFDATHSYQIRMAPAPEDLNISECALTTDLPIFDNTAITVDGSPVPYRSACPNNAYEVSLLVTNSNAEGVVTRGYGISDWLLAYPFDTCFVHSDMTAEQRKKADEAFLNRYGYDRKLVEESMYDFRRLPEPASPNANYTVTDPSDIQADAFIQSNHYEVVRSLCDKGLLTLYKQHENVFVGAKDTVIYWLFPILETATTESGDVLSGCNDPHLLLITSREMDKEHLLNLSPIKRADMTNVQRTMVPNVRVSARMANVAFTVPISDMENVSLGWDSCQVVASNDPQIADLIGTNGFSMHYTQDKIWTLVNDADKYYKPGDYITFTPVDQAHVDAMKKLHDANPNTYHDNQPGLWRVNTHQLRAGYTYTMRVQLLNRDNSHITDEKTNCPIGYASFNVIVVPDIMVWTPTVSNEWGDDRNWRAMVDGHVLDYGYAPLAETMVIIPKQTDGSDMYPCITERNLQPMDVHYAPDKCRKIHFNARTRLLNQHLLRYDSAYVDMLLPQAEWYSMSAPLQDMYSGDFFIPHTGNMTSGTNVESADDFTVSRFQGTRSREAAYAFWLSYYNKSVSMLHSTGSSTTTTGTAAFLESNAMNEPLRPAQGFNVLGFGPDNSNNADLVVRFPKPDNTYYYFDNLGNPTTDGVSLTRSNASKLAYPMNSDYTFSLSNSEADTVFLFGNPTMAYIDMERFLDGNTHLRPYFQYIDGSAWRTVTIRTSTGNTSARFVAPMQSVKLTALTPAQSLTVTLRPEHLTLSNTNSTVIIPAPKKQSSAAPGHTVRSQVMDITAFNDNGRAFATLAKIDFANDNYDPEEDVVFVSSGVEAEVNGLTATTPLNIYTVAGTQALSADVRAGIGVVPVGFLIADDYREETLTISFRLSEDWDTECYFCDSETGDRWRICNDTQIRIATPSNHALRYYIQGPDRGITTDIVEQPTTESVYAFSQAAQQVTVVATSPIASVEAFDLAGRAVARIGLSDKATPVCTLAMPAGVVLLRVQLTTGHTAQIKALVR